jgi:hypothetical protein
MLKQLYEIFADIVSLLKRQDRLEKIVEKQGQELKELSRMVERLIYEQQRAAEREAYERRLLLLEMENRMLKEKLQLPPRPEDKQEHEENKK